MGGCNLMYSLCVLHLDDIISTVISTFEEWYMCNIMMYQSPDFDMDPICGKHIGVETDSRIFMRQNFPGFIPDLEIQRVSLTTVYFVLLSFCLRGPLLMI